MVLDSLRADGFVVLPASLPPDDVDRLRRAFPSRPLPGAADVDLTDATPERAAWDRLREHRAVALAQRYAGVDLRPGRLWGRDPRARVGEQQWHTDSADRARCEVVTLVWMLDDFAASGTHVVPGSHLVAARPPQRGDPVGWRAVEGAAGSLLLVDGRLWHRCPAHLGPDRRRSALLSLVAAPPTCRSR